MNVKVWIKGDTGKDYDFLNIEISVCFRDASYLEVAQISSLLSRINGHYQPFKENGAVVRFKNSTKQCGNKFSIDSINDIKFILGSQLAGNTLCKNYSFNIDKNLEYNNALGTYYYNKKNK